jgi:hypothetical protein
MQKKSAPVKSPLTDFFSAATKAASNKKSAAEVATRDRAAEAARWRRVRAAKQREMDAALAPHNAILNPVLDALMDLPADKNGDEFLMRVTTGMEPNPISFTREPVMEVWMLYSQRSQRDICSQTIPHHHSLTMYRKDGADGAFYAEINGKPMLHITVGPDLIIGGSRIWSGMISEGWTRGWNGPEMCNRLLSGKTHKSLSDLPAAIGAWVAEVAPERLPALAKRAKKPTPKTGPKR